MRLRIHQIVARIGYQEAEVAQSVARRLGVPEADLEDLEILRRSLDARGKDRPPRYVLTVDVTYRGDLSLSDIGGQVVSAPEPEPPPPPAARAKSAAPLIVGAGPAGLMAALVLAEAGYEPLVLERGQPVETRHSHVEVFWRDALLDPDSNVLYGEGGAGLFSDGKLTARSKDRHTIRRFFDVLVSCGAPTDILIDAEPHLGSDRLSHIIPALRRRIESFGGEIRFGARVDDLLLEGGVLQGVVVAGREILANTCFLATGHSARDTYRMLDRRSVTLQAKPFAAGVRLELPQQRINQAQYGRWASRSELSPARFRLTWKEREPERRCYTFCMCPGGVVMACASSEGMLTTNGMSYSGQAKPLGNAAFLVPISPHNIQPVEGGSPPLWGVELQESMERAAFAAGGSDYSLPAQRLSDFLVGSQTAKLPARRSCTRAVSADLASLLPNPVSDTLRRAIPRMLGELGPVRVEEILVYAPETRSSSPVRVVRHPDTFESVSVTGLIPVGEGAGYAGGIVSSAIDGIQAAQRWLAES